MVSALQIQSAERFGAGARIRTHRFTYAGLFAFTAILYFRPHEFLPDNPLVQSSAMIAASATLVMFVLSELLVNKEKGRFTPEVACLVMLVLLALFSLPFALDPGLGWEMFSGVFIKVALIFFILAYVLDSRFRVMGLIWLVIGSGVMLSMEAIKLYLAGQLEVEGYRINVDYGGMFGNPNDLSLHLVICLPLTIAVGLQYKSTLLKLLFLAAAVPMVIGIMLTHSRGGFLGFGAACCLLFWKLGRRHRLRTAVLGSALALLILVAAPGNYGLRMASILVPSLDPVGSSDQRRDILQRSIVTTLRNPLGIGVGNSPLVGIRNLETHNAYTQVSSELGWLAVPFYLAFMVYPFRRLRAIERDVFDDPDAKWTYYLSVGIQASILGYMVSSFFGSVAYQWFIYYPIAYAIAVRRLHSSQLEGSKALREPGAQMVAAVGQTA